jgi:hypothetical protein
MTEELTSFDIAQVGDVLADVSGGVEASMRRELTEVLDKELRQFLFGLVNMPKLANLGAPHVMLRVRTFQTILDDFRGVLGGHYDPTLARIGRTIGFNFGISLLRVLQHAHRVPKKYDALLEFWAKFDSAAQMGEYTLVLKEREGHDAIVDVSIKDLFLTMGYDDDPLRHCPFITGYFEGALDTSMFLWARWIKQSDYKDPTVLWSVAECDDVVREDQGVVRFTLRLVPERWPDLKDLLVRAVDLTEHGSWAESILLGRMVLERGLVHCADEHPPELKFSFERLLQQIERVRLPIDVDRWRQTYAECSQTAHTVKVVNEITVTNILFNVWMCVKEAEHVVLTPEQGAEIKKTRDRYIIKSK